MNKSILAVSIGAAISFGAQANILITEYVEGSGYNKAIEIGNTSDIPIDITGYKLVRYTDGDREKSEELTLSGTIAANDTLVMVTTDARATQELKDLADNFQEVIKHNGNDPYELFDAAGNLIDQVGEFGDKDFAKDNTLQRIVFTPSKVYDASKFAVQEKDTWADLGQIGEPVTPPEAIAKTIMELQGESWTSPFIANGKYTSNETFLVKGIVTAIQTTALGDDLPVGFFMQDETGDGDENTSDGIFVPGHITGLTVGDKVSVTGKVKEAYGWTQIAATKVEPTGEKGTITSTAIRPLESDDDFDFTLERHEGMLVKFDKESDMRVSRTFGFDHKKYRNNMVVSNGQVNIHPNQNNAPATDAAKAQTDSNKDKRIIVESFEEVSKGTHIPWYPDFGKASAVPMTDGTTTSDDYIRIGDVLDSFEGVVSYSYGEFRFFVTNEVTKDNFVRDHSARTEKPALKEGGDLRIASFNVLNYFNSPFGGDCNPTDPYYKDSVKDQPCSNRGAATPEEFALQGDKIARAIAAIDADIVGLMEIENNGFGDNSAVAHLVAKINEHFDNEADHYVFVKGNEGDQYVGSDAIASQVIFRPTKVTLDTYRLIEMPQQHAPEVAYIDTKNKDKTESGDNYQRDTISPTFKINGTNETITVAVNHLKSKGSPCWEDVQTGKQLDPDFQGSCENFRVSAAYQLGKMLKDIDGYKLILGDLNSYGNEDPVMVLTNRDNAPADHVIKAARDTFIGGDETSGTPLHGAEGAVIDESYGYINIVKQIHPDSYSYSYGDEIGTLDYILVTPELESKVIDATDWNINAGESTLFEYSNEYNCVEDKSKCSTRYSDLFRASDHDPAIIDLKFAEDKTDAEPAVIVPPSEPVNPPADLPTEPEAPVAGEPIKVMMDLTDLGGFALHVGDKAMLNFAKITTFKAASAGGTTSYVELTEEIIQQGWVELQGKIDEAGEYQMTKVIESVTGEKYVSEPVSVKVAENPKDDHGGSTGLIGLLSLLGLGFLRRKVQG